MRRNLTLDDLKERISVCTEELSNIDSKRDKKLAELKKLKQQFADEERKVRTHNLCTVGGMAYSRFGDDISPDDFSEMLDFLFSLEEVKEFVESEKEKRYLRDNPPDAASEENETADSSVDTDNSEIGDNDIQNNYSDTDENDFSDNRSDTDDEITDEKTSA